ncbi:MAG: FG-GAP repeat protein [Deltaproteobacteria bacterium]|nr:FG-GAP repeat protein [Deltaproteobacteria bacterium]
MFLLVYGPVDGDGHADILIGAPGSDAAGDHAAAAYLVPSGLVW